MQVKEENPPRSSTMENQDFREYGVKTFERHLNGGHFLFAASQGRGEKAETRSFAFAPKGKLDLGQGVRFDRSLPQSLYS